MAREIEDLAGDILDISRNRLLVNLRYLGTALGMYRRVVYDGTISSDADALYFSPEYIIRTYRESSEEVTRQYLHTVLHSVFLHQFLGGRPDRVRWNLACDIAVEAAISEMGLACVRSPREESEKRLIRRIRRESANLTTGRIYDWLLGIPDERLIEFKEAFSPDDHSLWYAGDDDAMQGADSRQVSGASPDNVITPSGELWKDIARKIDMELEMFAKVKGDASGALMQNIRAITRERYDYSEFLRKFASVHEEIHPSEEEFDYIYYTYGLNSYGNMPLIEPLEYREDKRIREFVIAIDTSGSVAGDEVRAFLKRTYEILSQQNSFFKEVRIHIIQCDAVIQSDYVITRPEDFKIYLEEMEIMGLGGTDFRPVFHYVDKLIHDGELQDLKGLIYFTDGLGTFPKTRPDYRTAFVFLSDGITAPRVPVWAMKVLLTDDELREG